MRLDISAQESILERRIRQGLVSSPTGRSEGVSTVTVSWCPKDRKLLCTKITQNEDENEARALPTGLQGQLQL